MLLEAKRKTLSTARYVPANRKRTAAGYLLLIQL